MQAERKVKDITIVSLSDGILGEPFIRHELDIGISRLESYGIKVHFSGHARAGRHFIEQHPEKRAEDLLTALRSDTDMILCAIGGDDTYRLLPYLFDNDELKNAVKPGSDKIFLGFSDTTMNHFMLHKIGMRSFYGQAFLPDICEIGKGMLPYTGHYFEELITAGHISEIQPADVWYDCRKDFGEKAIGTSMPSHPNNGFELLQGASVFSGQILGGCIDTIFDMFNGNRYSDSPYMCRKYRLFPELQDWKGRILLLESSEEQVSPEKYRRMVQTLRSTGIFNVINGILIGKPADEKYFEEYKQILKEEIKNPELSVAVNINVGHAVPRCIIPFGIPAVVDIGKQVIRFENNT